MENKVQNKMKTFGIPVAVILIAVVAYFSYDSYLHVGTDNAQVSAHFLMLSSRVNGTISKVFVEDHQKVKAGDILAQIDTSDYSNAKTAALAQVASLEARVNEARVNFKRAEELIRTQAISKERFDKASADLKDLDAKLKAAESLAEQAGLNESYTRIIAPNDGIIARKAVEPGQFVPAGQPLFGFVAENKRWILANLKETELEDVRLGQKVKIHVDALAGQKFEGKVISIAPSTGAAFSLLPPDNATGNFTKVVQRIPVKIELENLSEKDIDALQLGLSAVISIRVH
ncbi:MAG: HlyD family secretion protein [Bacteriovorax sp.]|nr:HlyD family secretion protein [Bacteriovorax sp.]